MRNLESYFILNILLQHFADHVPLLAHREEIWSKVIRWKWDLHEGLHILTI